MEEACHDRPTSHHRGSPAANAVVTCGVFMGVSKLLCWWQPFTGQQGNTVEVQWFRFHRETGSKFANPCSSQRDALWSMPSFWDRGSEYKIIMVDPFLEFWVFFSGSRLASGGVAP